MYRQAKKTIISAEKFELPFDGKLSEDNRWVIMAKLIPWGEFEEEYAQKFSEDTGAPAKSFRMALGALIIKEKLGISDRETIEQIKENPYLQYFLGMSAYTNKAPFNSSMLVHFRSRISQNLLNVVTRQMGKQLLENNNYKIEIKNLKEEINKITNRGKLILDASFSGADISYLNDLAILNQARQKIEKIIDSLYQNVKEKLSKKPRTYRKIAKKDYLEVAKKHRPSEKQTRKAIRKQLQYIKRNLSYIEQLTEAGASLTNLSIKEYKSLLVVTEVYRQQLWMYENKQKRIDDQIVRLTQPHIRPIVRGKVGRLVEFGAKISASSINEYVFLDRISSDNFNESQDFKTQVEEFKNFTGYYPESVHVDQIYRTRENRAWCKERGIKITGSSFGRPSANIRKEKK